MDNETKMQIIGNSPKHTSLYFFLFLFTKRPNKQEQEQEQEHMPISPKPNKQFPAVTSKLQKRNPPMSKKTENPF